ncbi:MAG TPA: hypothetical protein VKC34_05235, partial [Blastocatellia bacterium]|nr:hypothetical protein [Blastocatellia bacterium]
MIGACAIAGAVVLMNMQTLPGAKYERRAPESTPSPEARAPESAPSPLPVPEPAPAPPVAEATPPTALPAPGTEDAIPSKPAAPVPMEPATETDLTYLTAKNLLLPVGGVRAEQLRDSYYDGRSEGRTHEALDIMAPQD